MDEGRKLSEVFELGQRRGGSAVHLPAATAAVLVILIPELLQCKERNVIYLISSFNLDLIPPLHGNRHATRQIQAVDTRQGTTSHPSRQSGKQGSRQWKRGESKPNLT